MDTKRQAVVRVKIRQGMCKTLAQQFGVTPSFVSMCMSGLRNTELAFKIRKIAVELGGDPIFGEISEQKSKLRITGKLAKQFGVSTQTIRNAKRNITQTDLAESIREAIRKYELGINE